MKLNEAQLKMVAEEFPELAGQDEFPTNFHGRIQVQSGDRKISFHEDGVNWYKYRLDNGVWYKHSIAGPATSNGEYYFNGYYFNRADFELVKQVLPYTRYIRDLDGFDIFELRSLSKLVWWDSKHRDTILSSLVSARKNRVQFSVKDIGRLNMVYWVENTPCDIKEYITPIQMGVFTATYLQKQMIERQVKALGLHLKMLKKMIGTQFL